MKNIQLKLPWQAPHASDISCKDWYITLTLNTALTAPEKWKEIMKGRIFVCKSSFKRDQVHQDFAVVAIFEWYPFIFWQRDNPKLKCRWRGIMLGGSMINAGY